MNDLKDLNLPPELEQRIATAMKIRKPYLLGIEDWVQDTQDGFVEVRLEIRKGTVEKMTKFSGKYWIKQKEPLESLT